MTVQLSKALRPKSPKREQKRTEKELEKAQKHGHDVIPESEREGEREERERETKAMVQRKTS